MQRIFAFAKSQLCIYIFEKGEKMKNNKENIKGRNYEVKIVDEIDENDASIVGQTNITYKQIFIKDRQIIEEKLNTIIHELLHANFYECGLYDAFGDEDIIRFFEIQFLSILKQFLKIVKIVLPNKKYEANKINELLNAVYEIDNNDLV